LELQLYGETISKINGVMGKAASPTAGIINCIVMENWSPQRN